MANIIKIKRGLDANVPVTGLNIGEPLFTTDTERLFICKTSTEKIEYGKRSLFLEKANNLNDLADKPTARTNLDVYSKSEVDGLVQGLAWKDPVKVATSSSDIDITLSGLQTIDGISVLAGDRVLVKNQETNPETNGIYIASATAWIRATDCDSEADLLNMAIFVESGTENSDAGFVMTTNSPIVVDTTPLAYVQFIGLGSVVAGVGLKKTGNVLDIDLTELTEETVNADTDLIAIYDMSTSSHKKMTRANFLSGISSDTKKVLISSADTTEGFLEEKFVAGNGITVTKLNTGLDEDLEVKLNVNGLTELATEASATNDYAVIYDSVGAIEKKITVNNFVANATIDGGTF